MPYGQTPLSAWKSRTRARVEGLRRIVEAYHDISLCLDQDRLTDADAALRRGERLIMEHAVGRLERAEPAELVRRMIRAAAARADGKP